MKETVCAALAGLLLCTALPSIAAVQLRRTQPQTSPETEMQTAEFCAAKTENETEEPMEITDVSTQEHSFDKSFNLPVLFEGGVDSMNLHDYLVGALLGEMPLSFDMEALKAQAIACRTYALRQYASRKHDPAAVCTASNCCECWKPTDGAEEANIRKAAQAVSETDGLVLTYDGKLIEATFFSCAGERTENASDVWGNAIPYLISVDSPGEKAAPRYSGEVTVPLSEFREKLQTQTDVTLQTQFKTEDFIFTRTEGGGVETVQFGGETFTGKTFRKLFGLNSTDFHMTISGDVVTFSTTGYGHRVGLSQYGAQAMASDGASCEQILTHYYTGVQLTDCRMIYPQK